MCWVGGGGGCWRGGGGLRWWGVRWGMGVREGGTLGGGGCITLGTS